jgi:polyhydroxyalkanoic acid synthase PhaR subunit
MSDSSRQDPPPDPFALWRQAYETAERTWSKTLEQTTASEAFAASLGRSLDSYLGFQKVMRDNMQLYLESMNFPTRNDVARLGELIVNLENKIDDLDDRVDSLLDEVAALRSRGGQDAAKAADGARGRTGRQEG